MDMEDLRVTATLGRGSFGTVRLARHAVTGGKFACKCQAKQKILAETMEPYIVTECKILAMVDNPFVLKLYATFQNDRYVYFVLELLPGGELYGHLRRLVSFPEPMLRFFVAQVVLAFECLHAKGVLYRDLKPENLVLDAAGYLKVVDFGLSKVLTAHKTWTMCGTPEYLAPEILRNEGHNCNVDFWMLGILTFELAHGTGPFVARDEMALFEMILKMRPKFPRTFSKHLRDLLGRLLTHQKKRLGNSVKGWGMVKRQMWFSGHDWDGLVSRQVTPPIKPSSATPRKADPHERSLGECESAEARPCPEWTPELPRPVHDWRNEPKRDSESLSAAANLKLRNSNRTKEAGSNRASRDGKKRRGGY
jgi:serine/threonine protein kinase